MHRTLEGRHWRLGFAAGVAALVLSVAGQVAMAPAVQNGSCSLAAQPSVLAQIFDNVAPRIRAQSVAHRVAVALLGAVLHGSCG